jgi:hypothetical protein
METEPIVMSGDVASPNRPKYWPTSGWAEGWGDADGDEARMIGDLATSDAPSSTFQSAKLSRDSSVGRAICAYLTRCVGELSYTSQKREATRMEHAEWELHKSPTKDSLTAKQKAGLAFNLREGEADGPPPPSSGPIEVRKIKVLRNDALWRDYVATREALRKDLADEDDPLSKVSWSYSYATGDGELPSIPLLDPAVGETLLFHGTSREIMKKIAAGGFKPDIGRNKGTEEKPNYGALGQGSYFSDNFAKVMTYTSCRHCFKYRCECSHGDGRRSKRLALLSRVLLGHTKKLHGVLQPGGNLRSQTTKEIKDGRHSVYAKGVGINPFSRAAGTNEFVVKRAAQIYPEFVIYWVHV